MVKKLGADVHLATRRKGGFTVLHIAAQVGHLTVVRYLVKEVGVDVFQAMEDGATPLFVAASYGHLDVVRCLVKEFGADVNKTREDGLTALMLAARYEREDVVAFLIKYGANIQDSSHVFGTAADISREYIGPNEQTQSIEARAHCANFGCDGAGVKKCAGCLKVYYCARECQLAHWQAHKAECRQSADTASSNTI
jgi:ankyrin repeat protein